MNNRIKIIFFLCIMSFFISSSIASYIPSGLGSVSIARVAQFSPNGKNLDMVITNISGNIIGLITNKLFLGADANGALTMTNQLATTNGIIDTVVYHIAYSTVR